MKREYRVLSRLWRAYDRAPARLLVLRRPRRRRQRLRRVGVPAGRGGLGRAARRRCADLPDAGRRIGFATVDALADLHLVDPAACGLGELGRPAGYLARQLAGWRQRWELVATPDLDGVMSALGERLRAHAARVARADDRCTTTSSPTTASSARASPTGCVSVFDWDMATLGDPLADLGMLLNYWPDPSDTDDDRALHVPGMEDLGLPTRAEVVARYAAAHRRRPGRHRLVRGVRLWKNAVVTQQLHQRYVRGESTDERMAAQAGHPPMLAARTERLLADLLEGRDARPVRPDRQGSPSSPAAAAASGARWCWPSPPRRRRGDRQPQARELRGPGRRGARRRPGAGPCPSPATSAGGTTSTPSSTPCTASSGGSTCSSTTPAWRRCTPASSRSARSCSTRSSASTSRARSG